MCSVAVTSESTCINRVLVPVLIGIIIFIYIFYYNF